MTLTIGRSVFSTATAISHSGGAISLTVEIDTETTGGNVSAAKALRQQVLAMVGNVDEPVVPIVWDDDTDVTGYYKIEAADVDPFPVYLANGYMVCRIQARRVGADYVTPPIDVMSLDAARSDANHVIGSSPAIWIPSAYSWCSVAPTANTPIRACEGGSVTRMGTNPAFGLYVISFRVAPAEFYTGSCEIEYLVGGVWRPLVGRSLPSGIGVTSIRVGNGITRTTYTAAGAISLSWWSGTAWEAVGTFACSPYGSATARTFTGPPTVERNAPESCIISIPNSGHQWPLTITATRGQLFQTLDFNGPGRISATTTTAATLGTGHIFQTAAGATGNRWILGSTSSFASNLTAGYIEEGPTDALFPAFIGVNPNATTTEVGGTTTAVTATWWIVSNPIMRVGGS